MASLRPYGWLALVVCTVAWLLWPRAERVSLPEAVRVVVPVETLRVAPEPLHVARRPGGSRTPVEDEPTMGRIVGYVGSDEGVARGGLLFLRGDAVVRALAVAEDGWFELSVGPGRYRLHAVGPDDVAGEPDAPVWVEVGAGEEVEVRLDFAPSAPEPQLLLTAIEDGFEVTWTLEGGAADRMGVLPGDRVIGVDGGSAAELDADDLLERLEHGEVGTLTLWFAEDDGGFARTVPWDRS